MELDPKKQSNLTQDLDKNGVSADIPVSTFKENLGEKTNTSINERSNSNIIRNQSKRKLDRSVRRIRTYKDDIAQAVRSQKASFTSVVAAEQKRRAGIPTDIIKKSKVDFKKIGIIFGSMVLIAFAVGAISFFVFFYEKEVVIIEQEVPSFIFVEKQKEINIMGNSAREILQALGTERSVESLPLGQIEQLYLTEIIEESGIKITHIISAKDFLTRIRAQVSSSFLRSLEPSFMLGIHAFNQNQPFMIFKSNSYQHSFAGLLEWERTMYNDFFLFTGRKADPVAGVPIHPQTGKEIVLRENFEDRIIRNIDVRVLASETGDIEFLYAFPNQQTLIITTNEHTLTELVTRLNSVRVF